MNLFSKFLSPKPKENPKLANSLFTSSSTLEIPPDHEAQRQHGRPDTSRTGDDTLYTIPSHHDPPAADNLDEYNEADSEQYLRFSPARKVVIVIILTYCSFLAPIASTAVLAAVPEVAKTFKTTGEIINASNALYLAFMGLSSTVWGPFSQVWGRRPVSLRNLNIRHDPELPSNGTRYRYLSAAPSCSSSSAWLQRYLQISLHISSSESSLPSKGPLSWSSAALLSATSSSPVGGQQHWDGSYQAA